ncbi:MAG TPA: phosphoadenylyl-sulfate reductase [Polyangiaceae bacterium]|nr:phosphoadenylyl-sulfate reductase [Polyangiaceae bacterium]
MQLYERDLATVNARLEGKTPIEILEWAHDAFGMRAAILSSMQRAGSVLCHMADRAGLAFEVVFVDTGVLHPETLATRAALSRTHRLLNVVTLTPEHSFAEQTRIEGLLYLSKEGQERCCDLRKSAPLRAIRGRYAAFVSALRRGEGGARANVPIVALDVELGALRVHPFADVSARELQTYLEAHGDVALNPLHAMGFPTIGCYTCTTPVRPDEPERAGRWRHLAGVEYCGINPTDRGARDASIELADDYKGVLGLLG